MYFVKGLVNQKWGILTSVLCTPPCPCHSTYLVNMHYRHRGLLHLVPSLKEALILTVC